MTLALAGSVVTMTAPRCLTPIPSTDDLMVALTASGSKVRIYDAPTRSQVGSDIATTNIVQSLAPLTSNLIVGACPNTTWHVINISGASVTDVASLNNIRVQSFNGQQVAGDPANGVALGTSSTNGNIVKLVSSPSITGSILSPAWLVGFGINSIIKNPDNNNFIVATTRGTIHEITASGVVVHQYGIPAVKEFTEADTTSLTAVTQIVGGMAYHHGYLLVSTNLGHLILFDHEQGKELSRRAFGTGINGVGCMMGNYEHTVLVPQGTPNGSPGLTIMEFDMFRTPIKPKGYLFTTGSSAGWQSVINVGGTFVMCNSNAGQLIFVTLSGARTIAYTDTSLIDPDTTDSVDGHCVLLDDGGAGDCDLMFAAPVSADGRSLPYTSGADLVKVGISGIGQTEKIGWTRPV